MNRMLHEPLGPLDAPPIARFLHQGKHLAHERIEEIDPDDGLDHRV